MMLSPTQAENHRGKEMGGQQQWMTLIAPI
jgi:hypothetical protein